ncbi:MAG: thiamine pyrophosphate-dependent enzyme [Bacteroidota bacterium]
MPVKEKKREDSIKQYIEEILNDFKLACRSREASLLGRKEVLTGKAKFGIFGDGKELAQIAMAKQFQKGDWRSGYYRDQTFMMAIDKLDVSSFFAGVYAHADLKHDPHSGGRQMGGHYTTRNVDDDGEFLNVMESKNSSACISPTGGQMPRLVGLGLASKLFRKNKALHGYKHLSSKGNEVAFGTIGDASTSEGPFWEAMNAIGVMQIPVAMSVWDDGYGISVPKEFQTTKGSISEALAGFQRTEENPGFEIFKTKGWDYPHLIKTYKEAIELCRKEHVPVLIHVEEVTQPQGHSTSGSHERYKSKKRLQWEEEFDCVAHFKQWIIDFEFEGQKIASKKELDAIQLEIKEEVKAAQKKAWEAFSGEIKNELNTAHAYIVNMASQSAFAEELNTYAKRLKSTLNPFKKDTFEVVREALVLTRGEESNSRSQLKDWLNNQQGINAKKFNSKLFSDAKSALDIPELKPLIEGDDHVDGRIILRENFKILFNDNPLLTTFGEDTGHIGGVNQSMEGMQDMFGSLRVMDTGIRECTIVGQGIGMAMRGMRPIAEIQYLDYLLYAIQIMSDDLATVHYRTNGQQIAPLIVRTRGHRLEGIWHSGSPMGMIINSLRGIHVCVPRNMTEAAGMYNTLLQSNDPGLIIEPLNGYRTKEPLPSNFGKFTVALGMPEVIREGEDITMVSYGSTFNLCQLAAKRLEEMDIDVELIDVRTLLPFDREHVIAQSLEKTNKLMIVDEDVSGGASAYILDKVLTEQKGYYHLDSEPVTLSAKDHRPAYSSDGDYFSKPSISDIFERAYAIMSESDPHSYPDI